MSAFDAKRLQQLYDANVRLLAALFKEWELNHWEHCGHGNCTSYGGPDMCKYDRPPELIGYQQQEPEVTEALVKAIDALVAPEFATGNWETVESDTQQQEDKP